MGIPNGKCVYGEWSGWKPCVNGQSSRSRLLNIGDPNICNELVEFQPCKEDIQTPQPPCCKVCNSPTSFLRESSGKSSDYSNLILLSNLVIIILLLVLIKKINRE